MVGMIDEPLEVGRGVEAREGGDSAAAARGGVRPAQ